MRNMDGSVTFLDMSGMYTRDCALLEYIKNETDVKWIYMRDIRGTDAYCDDEAENVIQRRLAEHAVNVRSVHYIDNGNYHYLSKLLLDAMDEPFNLLVIDNHPDMQSPAFGKILSCGSWVKDLLEDNIYVNNVCLCGVNTSLVTEEMTAFGKVRFCRPIAEEILQNTSAKLPLYISIDKDALTKQDYETNWDQGSMRITELESLLRDITAAANVCGADICGGSSSPTTPPSQKKNLSTDIRIYKSLT